MIPLPYLFQVNMYWLLCYACYWLLLRRQTHFGLNRAYLLGVLMLGFILPVVQLPEVWMESFVTKERSVTRPVIDNFVIAETQNIHTAVEPQNFAALQQRQPIFAIDWTACLGTLYIIGLLFMSVRLGWSLRRLLAFFRGKEYLQVDGCQVFILDSNVVGSFSFFNKIVINQKDYEENFDTILRHELVHVQQRHSLDLLFLEALTVFFWYNPVLLFYKKSLQEVHEYQADRSSVLSREQYATFLVSYALQSPTDLLSNSFHVSSLLKKRIFMLYKKRNSKWSLVKYLTIAPLVGLVLILTAGREHTSTPKTESLMEQVSLIPEKRMDENRNQKSLVKPANTTIKGTVRSSKTQALLPGANVIVAGTNAGTTTDENGTFELKNVPLMSKLAISYIGYEIKTIEITKPNQDVNAELLWQQRALEDVVVVGYSPLHDDVSQAKNGLRQEIPDSVFFVVEQLPEFPGGKQAMYQYLGRNIHYPTEALRKGIQGKVIIQFIVSENGMIREPQVTKRVGYGLDEEALRVVLNMNSWNPGKQNGRPVPMEYSLPIEFQIEK
ncbi:M56 family metallopeptidase [Arundinibacter roseus]|uniref:TonB family protein n=1 Tax=Arundinibacter roseus TaxID=2070510 RepID=A0A4R4KAA4_9BACT|nr:M56 family metallopeptidase [Arundinibacter roseus]TDB63496.1 TonB family protein [Arundinibacter roseus]